MGFHFGHIAHPLSDPVPKGMGLRIVPATEGGLARPAAAAKKKAKSGDGALLGPARRRLRPGTLTR